MSQSVDNQTLLEIKKMLTQLEALKQFHKETDDKIAELEASLKEIQK